MDETEKRKILKQLETISSSVLGNIDHQWSCKDGVFSISIADTSAQSGALRDLDEILISGSDGPLLHCEHNVANNKLSFKREYIVTQRLDSLAEEAKKILEELNLGTNDDKNIGGGLGVDTATKDDIIIPMFPPVPKQGDIELLAGLDFRNLVQQKVTDGAWKIVEGDNGADVARLILKGPPSVQVTEEFKKFIGDFEERLNDTVSKAAGGSHAPITFSVKKAESEVILARKGAPALKSESMILRDHYNLDVTEIHPGELSGHIVDKINEAIVAFGEQYKSEIAKSPRISRHAERSDNTIFKRLKVDRARDEGGSTGQPGSGSSGLG